MTETPQPANHEDASTLEALLRLLPQSTRSLEISVLLSQVFDPVDHLRQYVPLILEHQKVLDSRSPQEIADAGPSSVSLSEDRRTAIRALADQVVALQDRHLAGLELSSHLQVPEPAVLLADPFVWMAKLAAEVGLYEGLARDLAPALSPALSLSTVEQIYLTDYMLALARTSHRDLVLRLLAIAATAQIQPYVGRLLSVALRAKAELEGDAAEASVSKEVRQLLMQGPREWREKVVHRVQLRQLDLAVDWHELADAWDLRNLLLHRGGIVDEAYLEDHPNSASVGTHIPLGTLDVDHLFDLAATVRFAFAVAATEQVQPGSGVQMAGEHYLWYWREFQSGRWGAAAGIARVAMAFADSPTDAAGARCNLWIAQERGEGPESIRAEVANWDILDLPRKFQLAKTILLHDDAVALKLIAQLHANSEVSDEEVRTAPLFARLREAGDLADYL